MTAAPLTQWNSAAVPEPAADAEARADLDARIAKHIARLENDPDDDLVARGLASYLRQASGVYEFIAGIANRRGHSFTADVQRTSRNEHIRELARIAQFPVGTTATEKAIAFAKEIENHRPRDTNPYSQFSQRRQWLLGEICRLNKARKLGWRTIYNVLYANRI